MRSLVIDVWRQIGLRLVKHIRLLFLRAPLRWGLRRRKDLPLLLVPAVETAGYYQPSLADCFQLRSDSLNDLGEFPEAVLEERYISGVPRLRAHQQLRADLLQALRSG